MSSDPSPSSSVAASGPRSRVRPLRPGDEEPLVEMYSRVFQQRSLAQWRWLHEQAPEGAALIHVLEHAGRVIGCITHVPVSVWVQGSPLRQAIGCDLMILPEYRGQGGSRQLVEAFLDSEHCFDLNLGAVNERSSHVMGRYAGTVTMGHATRWVRTRGRVTRRVARLPGVGGAVERIRGMLVSRRRPPLSVDDLVELGSEIDALAWESASFAPCIRVRDSAYVGWHWLEQPGVSVRIRGVRDPGGGLLGFAVIGTRDESGGHEGLVLDLLARDELATRALMSDAWEQLTRAGCLSVACVYQDPRPWAERSMRRSGFRPEQGPHLACGALSSAAAGMVERLDSWYLTSVDTQI